MYSLEFESRFPLHKSLTVTGGYGHKAPAFAGSFACGRGFAVFNPPARSHPRNNQGWLSCPFPRATPKSGIILLPIRSGWRPVFSGTKMQNGQIYRLLRSVWPFLLKKDNCWSVFVVSYCIVSCCPIRIEVTICIFRCNRYSHFSICIFMVNTSLSPNSAHCSGAGKTYKSLCGFACLRDYSAIYSKFRARDITKHTQELVGI
jgi:hypothetical protein